MQKIMHSDVLSKLEEILGYNKKTCIENYPNMAKTKMFAF